MRGSNRGYESYLVSDNVISQQAWGLGVYSSTNIGPAIVEDRAILVLRSPGVLINDAGVPERARLHHARRQ